MLFISSSLLDWVDDLAMKSEKINCAPGPPLVKVGSCARMSIRNALTKFTAL